VVLFFIFLFINKSLGRQAKYERQLQQFKTDLEKQVKEKTAELSNVFDRMSDAVIAFDKDLRYTYLNQKAAEMIKKDPAAIIGKNVWEVFPDAVGSPTYEAFNKAMSEQHYVTNIDYYEPLNLWQENHIYPSADGLSLFIRDISERKKVEQEFEKSVETRRLIMNSALDAIICIDTESFVTVWTPQAEMIFGWKEEEIVGKKLSETIIPYRYRKGHEKGLAQYLKTGKGPLLNKLVEITALRKDGTEFPVELSITPFVQDEKIFFCGFIRDITERKKTEEQLSSERNLLRALIDNLPDYIYVKDEQSRYIITNKAFVDLVKAKSESETIGKTVIDFFGPKVGKINMEEDKEVLKNGEVIIDRDDPILLDQGEKRWLLTTKVPLKDKAGNTVGILGISKDITSRKEAEELLKNSERKYKLLFESNPMPMWMISMPDRKFVDVNNSAIHQYGYTKDEFLKMNAQDIRPPEDIPLLQKLSTDYIPGINYAGVWRHKKKNGTILKVDVITHDIVYEGRRVRLVLSNDVTKKLEAEERLNKSYQDLRDLTSRLQAIREEERAGIAREIHDELGQQLTVLKMDIAWLNKKIGKEDTDTKSRLNQLTEMVDETVKTVRRISSELRPSVLDDLGLVAAMDWHLKEFEKRSGIKTEFLEPDMDVQLGDSVKTALYRIMQESLTNVARHADAKNVKVKLEQVGFDVILTIEDDGKGFDKQKIAGKKTLGILGMKERTTALGGKYEVISSPGEGTTIRVVTPFKNDINY
jgi:PAS domain S-box-containing protein